MWLELASFNVIGNLVLRAAQNGILVAPQGTPCCTGVIISNIVGQSGAGGIVSLRPAWVLQNTSFENTGAGYEVHGGPQYSEKSRIENNIAADNTGFGLRWVAGVSPPADPTPGCNDWFANAAGASFGISPGPTDLAVGPLYCNLPADSVSLASASPLLNPPGCGLIGARGQGCVSPASVPSSPVGLQFSVMPTPSTGQLRFSLPAGQHASQIEVFDVSGGRRWSTTVPAGNTRAEWDGTDGKGHRLPAGTYYARLRDTGGASIARIVILR